MQEIKLNGIAYSSIRELAQAHGVPYTTVLHRLDAGRSIEEAVNGNFGNKKTITISGRAFESIAEAARWFSLSPELFLSRLQKGWTPEQAAGIEKREKVDKPRRTSPIVIGGIEHPSVTDAAARFGFTYSRVSKRLAKGMTPNQAFELDPFPEWFTPGKGQFAKTRKQERVIKEQSMNKRKCSRCKQLLPLSEFSRYSNLEEHDYYYHCKNCQSDRFLEYRYKISVDTYLEISKKQEQKCAICKKELNLRTDTAKRSKKVAVDHCHATGKVRGILCVSCNQALGFFKDSIENLQSAIKYLECHSQSNTK